MLFCKHYRRAVRGYIWSQWADESSDFAVDDVRQNSYCRTTIPAEFCANAATEVAIIELNNDVQTEPLGQIPAGLYTAIKPTGLPWRSLPSPTTGDKAK